MDKEKQNDYAVKALLQFIENNIRAEVERNKFMDVVELDFTGIAEETHGSMKIRIPLNRGVIIIEEVEAHKISALDIIKNELPGIYGYALEDKDLSVKQYCSLCHNKVGE